MTESNAKRQRRYRENNLDVCRERDAHRKREERRAGTDYAKRQRAGKRERTYKDRRNELRRTPEARAQQAAYMAERRKRPEVKVKERARAAVKRAIKRGDLVPPEACELCKREPGRRADGRRLIRADHHLGYDKEHYLDVRWVCPTCDGESEMERGNTTRGRWRRG